MSPELIITIVASIFAIAGFAFFVARKIPKRLKSAQYVNKWRSIQRMCGNKDKWASAIIAGDDLLDEVLKKKQMSGKTMGERLVSAHDRMTNNDAVWQAHKLAVALKQQLSEEETTKPRLREKEVKESLVAFRQALRDMGAV